MSPARRMTSELFFSSQVGSNSTFLLSVWTFLHKQHTSWTAICSKYFIFYLHFHILFFWLAVMLPTSLPISELPLTSLLNLYPQSLGFVFFEISHVYIILCLFKLLGLPTKLVFSSFYKPWTPPFALFLTFLLLYELSTLTIPTQTLQNNTVALSPLNVLTT